MSSGKYAALAGAISREQAINSVANNLANVNTSGYKRSQVSFESVLSGEQQSQQAKNINYDRVATNYNDFSPGSIRETSDPLNLALDGKGFFKVQGADEVLYTRSGNFAINSDGILTTVNGLPVLDNNGAQINVPETDIKNIHINNEGTLYVLGEDNTSTTVATLAVAEVEDTKELTHVSDTMFSLNDPNMEFPATDYRAIQGSLEMSNVNMTAEMTKMIDYNRTFETYHKVLRSYSTIAEKQEELGTVSG
jgi:flagellar basal-body rod protein FlgF/flagellar basal-body rod protein FlgG